MTRNLQKRLKKARYDQEKVVLERLRSVGSCVGEYVGDGLGEEESQSVDSASAEIGPVVSQELIIKRTWKMRIILKVEILIRFLSSSIVKQQGSASTVTT